MSFVAKVRNLRNKNRQNRAFDRAWRTAPTQASRDEMLFFSQRRSF